MTVYRVVTSVDAPAGMAPAPSTSTLRPARAAHRYRRGQGPKGQREPEDDESSGESSDGRQLQVKKEQTRSDGLVVRKDGLQVVNQGGAGAQQRTLKVEVREPSIQQKVKQGKLLNNCMT